MATENGNGMFNMPVVPAYGGYGNGGGFGNMFGGDGWWLILLFQLCGNGMWGGFGGGMWPMMMGGMGGFGLDYQYPWLNNSQHISDGFRDQTLQTSVTGLQNSVTAGFGDVQNALCSGFAGTTAAITGAQNAIAQQMYGNEIASLNRSFAEQTANSQGFNGLQGQLAQCCCDNRLATCQTQNIIQSEAAANRAAGTANTQAILDKLCQLELDNYKSQLETKNDTIAQLRSQLQYANMQASQVDQTAQLRASQATTANQLVNELRSCPIPAQPVYGNTPIFTCGNQGCGCNGFAN